MKFIPETISESIVSPSVVSRNGVRNTMSKLLPHHETHLRSEGFTEEHINAMMAHGVFSMTEDEAIAAGFQCRNHNGNKTSGPGLYFPFNKEFGQIRLDKPIKREDGSFAKYLTPAGAESQAWQPDAPVITEGAKDAWAGTLLGDIKTGAVAGVSHIRKALPEGTGQVIIFDADGWTNPSVMDSLIAGAVHLKGKVNLVPPIEGEPKAGLCEFFKAGHTAEDYRSLVDGAMKPGDFLEAWVPHFANIPAKRLDRALGVLFKWAVRLLGEAGADCLRGEVTEVLKGKLQGKIITNALKRAIAAATEPDDTEKVVGSWCQSEIAEWLGETFKNQWAFDAGANAWREYGADGVWRVKEKLHQIHELIRQKLEAIAWDFGPKKKTISFNFVSGVEKLLEGLLLAEFESDHRHLPFLNGLLDLNSRKLIPHAPEHKTTWVLPRNYNYMANDCPKIQAWLNEATRGNERDVKVLLCFMAATLRRMGLQKFLHLMGEGGSGKTTLANLLGSLVGTENVLNMDMELLTENDAIADLKDKTLTVFGDQDFVTRAATNCFKRLTGNEVLRARRLYQSGFQFRYQGMTVVTSNGPIFKTTTAKWLTRRLIQVEFNHRVQPGQVRDLQAEFEPELTGFTNFLLQISEAEIKETLNNDRLSNFSWETQVRADSLAGWVNDELIYVQGQSTSIGANAKEWKGREHDYDGAYSTLYGSYILWCEQNGHQATLARNNFSSALVELLESVLKWEGVGWKKTMNGRVITNVRLRAKGETTPTVGEYMTTSAEICRPMTTLCRPMTTTETQSPQEMQPTYDDHDDLLETFREKQEKNELEGGSENISEKSIKVMDLPSWSSCEAQNPSNDNSLGVCRPTEKGRHGSSLPSCDAKAVESACTVAKEMDQFESLKKLVAAHGIDAVKAVVENLPKEQKSVAVMGFNKYKNRH